MGDEQEKAVPWDLYPYQTETVDKVIARIDEGFKSPIVIMPTGTGKTQTYLALAKRALAEERAKRVMILAHRKDLVREPINRLMRFFPEMSGDVGMVMASWNEPSKRIVACSRDTVARGDMPRLQEINRFGPIDMLITDECHEFGDNKTSERMREYLRSENPDMVEVGFTATPRERQGHIWDTIAQNIELSWAIDNGYLVDPLWFPVQVGIKLSQVNRSRNNYGENDMNARSLAGILETNNWCDLIVKTHIERADRSGPTLAFTVSVEGSRMLSDAFNEAGVPAMHIDGEFTIEERRRVMTAILSGEVEVVCNCAIWTVGTDIPPVRNLHIARPTLSRIMYVQMIGRGLRLFNGKTSCRIFEYSDFDSIDLSPDAVWMGNILGLPVSRRAVVSKKEDGTLTGLAYTQSEGAKYLSGDPAELVTIQIDRLNRSKWEWIGSGNEWLMLPIGVWDQDLNERTYLVPPPSVAETALYAYVKRPDGRWFIGKVDGTDGMDYDRLLEIAEGRARAYGDKSLASRSMAWRSEPASRAQLEKFGGIVSPGMTRGEASSAITRKIMTEALRKKGFQVTP